MGIWEEEEEEEEGRNWRKQKGSITIRGEDTINNNNNRNNKINNWSTEIIIMWIEKKIELQMEWREFMKEQMKMVKEQNK